MNLTEEGSTGSDDGLREVASELEKYRPRRTQRYNRVNVLILSWQDGEDTFKTEAREMEQMFREHFDYMVRPYFIPSTNSQQALNLHVAKSIRDFGGEDNLIIVYYGGHNSPPEQDDSACLWAALLDGGSTLDWSIIQPQFLGAGCDVLILLDCCYAGQAARGRVSHTVEILAAADKDHWTPKGIKERPSFTKVLMREMISMLAQSKVVILPYLHLRMLKKEAGLSRQPLYASMTADGNSAIIRLTRWESLTSRHNPRSKHTWTERPDESTFVDLRLRLLQPLDSSSTATFKTWVTKGSPSFISDIEVITQALTEARAANAIADSLVRSENSEEAEALPSEAAQKALERLASLNKLIFDSTTGDIDALQLVQIIGNIREKAAAVFSIVTDCLTILDNNSLQNIRSLDLDGVQDLRDSISMRLTLLSDDEPQSQTRVNFDHPALANERLRTGKIGDTKVIVEYIYSDSEDKETRFKMTRQVSRVSVLHQEPKSLEFRTLTGLGFLTETMYSLRYGLIYKQPDGAHESFALLSDMIDTRKNLPLNERYLLALALCEGLFRLHSIGWFHKAIKCSNVLIYTSLQPGNSKDFSYDLRNPYYIGFDASRPIEAETRSTVDFSLTNNLYKHPDRWGNPTKFAKHHDIYSLGILLTEIGDWKLLPKMDSAKREFQQVKDPWKLNDFLLNSVNERLKHTAGIIYAEIMGACLGRTNWKTCKDWQAQDKFREKIWRPMASLCSLYQ
ncbi:hypothetical protein F5Y02DRAFT_416271 [Annulohypoxylon stygium]|nr:hypothetical protein F5Y02DRAFT_416271 [Annulohypoxylon stygium]